MTPNPPKNSNRKEKIYPNGEKYIGNFVNELKCGLGWYFYRSFDIYFGHWNQNLKNGFGIMYVHNQGYYIGFWNDDERNGFGQFNFEKGNLYKGYWKNGKKEGIGIVYYKDGSEFRGFFVNDKIHDQGQFIDSHKRPYLYIWDMGKIKSIQEWKKEFPGFIFPELDKKEFSPKEKKVIDEFNEHIKEYKTNFPAKFKLKNIQAFSEAKRDEIPILNALNVLDFQETIAKYYPNLKKEIIAGWNVDQVNDFLKKIHMESYSDIIKSKAINGALLLALSNEDFRKMGIDFGLDLMKKLF